MDYKKLATACAAAAMCLVLIALSTRLWANSRRHNLPGLVTLHVATDGRVFVLFGNDLYIENRNGESLEVISAEHFGLHNLDRDFAILDDDSILLPAADPAPGSLSENLQRYERMPDTSTDSSSGTVALQRCSLRTYRCTRLEGAGDYYHFRQSYRLAVDQNAGRIYVADTARQRLLILNMQGKVLAEKTSGVWFPNGILLAGAGRIEVADTNDHRAVTIAVADDRFGPDISQVGLVAAGHAWPFGIAREPNGALWAVLADNNMGHGVLERWPHDAKRAQLLPLPRRAEPSYPALLPDGAVLVPDSNLYRIYRFAADGREMPDFGSSELKMRLQSTARNAHLLNALFNYGWIVIAVLAIPLLHLTFYFQRQTGRVAGGETFTIDVQSQGLATQAASPLTWRATEYVFRRCQAATGNRSNRLLTWVAVGSIVLIAVVLYFTYQIPSRPGHNPDGDMSIEQGQIWFIVILLAVSAIYVWFSRRYERLYLTHTGIRYQTWLVGPLGFMAGLIPSWQLRWQEITGIRLCSRGNGRLPLQWQYELQDSQGRIYRISALFWRLQKGQDDTGLTIWQVNKRNPQILREAIGRTMLYKLLELSTRTGTRRSF